jgi:hypothetical protein
MSQIIGSNLFINISIRRFKKRIKRKKRKRTLFSNYHKHYLTILHNARKKGIDYHMPPRPIFLRRVINQTTKPKFSTTINYLAEQQKSFSRDSIKLPDDGNFEVPGIFSLIDNPKQSFLFLKKLFYALHQDKIESITLDYKKCTLIDLDASICMDILLKEFIGHINLCRMKGYLLRTQRIAPTNFIDNKHVLKTLFSIGAYSNIKKITVPFTDMEIYPLCIGSKTNRNAGAKREIDITNLMAYVLKCLKRSNKILTAEAEDNMYKVIGEILINAEEHSDTDKRYSIGYFQEKNNNGGECQEGVFNLVIFNFGQTIYEKFKSEKCPNQNVVAQMKNLSETYTKKNFFQNSEFEEETLWTLYALQEGVTSHKDWKRGNGSIRFIDSFFKLKGNNDVDNVSNMTILSGSARITFNGEYKIIEKEKIGQRKPSKLMTFNASGGFDEKPDKNFVTFADNYFPGTMIVAKIGIKYNILTEED